MYIFYRRSIEYSIMVPAWILQLQQKNAHPRVQDPCKTQLWPSPLSLTYSILNDFIYDFAKKLWRIFLRMYNFHLHFFTGEVLSFPIMVPA